MIRVLRFLWLVFTDLLKELPFAVRRFFNQPQAFDGRTVWPCGCERDYIYRPSVGYYRVCEFHAK